MTLTYALQRAIPIFNPTRHGFAILVQRQPTATATATATQTRIRIRIQAKRKTHHHPKPRRSARDERRRGGPSPARRRYGFRVWVGDCLRRQGHSRRILPRLRRPRALPLGDPPGQFLRRPSVPRRLLSEWEKERLFFIICKLAQNIKRPHCWVCLFVRF